VIPRTAYCALLLVALSGCDDPLKPVDTVEEPRVLAARVEVEGDPDRTSPNPGETVHVTWLVAAPNGDALAGFGMAACAAEPWGRGPTACRAEPFAVASAGPTSDRPRFDFTVPADLDPVKNPLLAVLGSLCPDATGNVDENGASCDAGEELAVSLDFLLATADDINQNPNFSADSLSLDGSPWAPAPALLSEPCEGLGLPELPYSKSEHTIDIGLPDSARQTLVQKSSADPARETLQLAHFASAGDSSSAFSQLLGTDPATSVSYRWNTPKNAPVGGRIVRFWFVARDGRGGSDFTERALCALP
jgi:hypothetical protein